MKKCTRKKWSYNFILHEKIINNKSLVITYKLLLHRYAYQFFFVENIALLSEIIVCLCLLKW